MQLFISVILDHEKTLYADPKAHNHAEWIDLLINENLSLALLDTHLSTGT